jgi:hypothetical protein
MVGDGVGLGVGPGVGLAVCGTSGTVGDGVGLGDGSGVGDGDGLDVGSGVAAVTIVGAAVPLDLQFVQQEQYTSSQSTSRVSRSNEHTAEGMAPLKLVSLRFTSTRRFNRSIFGIFPVRSVLLRSRFAAAQER